MSECALVSQGFSLNGPLTTCDGEEVNICYAKQTWVCMIEIIYRPLIMLKQKYIFFLLGELVQVDVDSVVQSM